MSMEELLEKVAREVGVGYSGDWDSDEYGIARDILKRFLLPLLEAGHDRGAAKARLEATKRWGEHEDVYEGSCGVHMPSRCQLCVEIARLERQAAGKA